MRNLAQRVAPFRRAATQARPRATAALPLFGALISALGRHREAGHGDHLLWSPAGLSKRSLTLALLLSAAIGVAAEAGLPAGKVKRSEGSVTVERAGQMQAVQVGTPVYVGDRLRTGADGAVGITLSDDTLLTAGPRSTLLINEFQFNPTTQEGGLLATLKGTLSVVTGLIGKQAPQNVRFKTPTVVLGIRGTEFIVDARGEDE